jgi:hypothetical protein
LKFLLEIHIQLCEIDQYYFFNFFGNLWLCQKYILEGHVNQMKYDTIFYNKILSQSLNKKDFFSKSCILILNFLKKMLKAKIQNQCLDKVIMCFCNCQKLQMMTSTTKKLVFNKINVLMKFGLQREEWLTNCSRKYS